MIEKPDLSRAACVSVLNRNSFQMSVARVIQWPVVQNIVSFMPSLRPQLVK